MLGTIARDNTGCVQVEGKYRRVILASIPSIIPKMSAHHYSSGAACIHQCPPVKPISLIAIFFKSVSWLCMVVVNMMINMATMIVMIIMSIVI